MQTKKNDLGVSPVIAVILMVAITVVLAGVVFLWAQSFTEDAGGGAETLSVDMSLSWQDNVAPIADVGTLTIEVLKGNIDWGNYQIIVSGEAAPLTSTVTTSAGGSLSLPLAGTYTIGNEYNVKIVNIEDQAVVVNTNVNCVAA